MIRIMTVMDNKPSRHRALTAEHGLSFYITTEDTKILFDFGAGQHVCDNAKKLNVPIDEIDYAICSHSHYDHSAGYMDFVERGLKCPFITGGSFFEEKYSVDGEKETYTGCGFGEKFLINNKVDWKVCNGKLKLNDSCYVLSGFDRNCCYEHISRKFVTRGEYGRRQDDFRDEVCLVIQTDKGLVVVVGCSHPGIINILTTVQRTFNLEIRAVVGGTHLLEAEEFRLRMTLARMKNMGVKLIGFNHCSGILIRELIGQGMEFTSTELGAGDCLFLE